MTVRLWNAAAYRWEIRHPKMWSAARSAWETNRGGSTHPGLEGMGSVFAPRYLGAGTIWQRDISDMPLAADSAALATWMWTQTPTRFNSCSGGASGAFGSKTSLNTSTFGTHPIVAVVVDSTDPLCEFQVIDSASLPETTADTSANNTASKNAIMLGKVPWPMGLNPPSAGDKALAIFDLGTGIIREYFGLTAVANKPGHWTATTCGFSINPPHFTNWHEVNYATRLQNGSSAVALMHNALGQIGVDEVRAKKINHALGFTMANATCSVPASYPATWSDGKFPNAAWSGWAEHGGGNGAYPGDSPRHGQWGRLPPTVDPLYNPSTGLPYNPLTQIIIEAAKTYGLVGTDTNAWCHAFNAESGYREKLITGVDPWTASGELATWLNPGSPSAAFDVSDFPWDLTQWAQVDWGRPNPDLKLRPDEESAFYPHGGT